MRSTLIAGNGDRLNVVPQPQQQSVMIWSHDKATGRVHQLVVPVDMAGAFCQAIEAAAKTACREKNGPGTGLRCLDADACKAGQAECPHFHLCCSAGAVL